MGYFKKMRRGIFLYGGRFLFYYFGFNDFVGFSG